MSIKNENTDKLPAVKKEQLKPERGFIRHCVFDYLGSRKLEGVNESFLRAAEADGFLRPLLQTKESVIQEDGSHKETIVNYYSPHQIFIVAALAKNQVHEGLLWGDSENLEFYKQQGFRMVNWGKDYAFNITLEQKNKRFKVVEQKKIGDGHLIAIEGGKKNGKESSLGHLEVCTDSHNFLMLLHSLEDSRYTSYDTFNPNKERHFTDAPPLYFDYSPLKNNPNLLKQYNLSIDKLRMLRVSVGHIATDIDPMEYWYYYLHQHPQWRKDLFKGEALLAQELYAICDLIVNVTEAVSDEKQPPLLELLHPDFQPFLMPKTEYATGRDVKSLWAAIEKFKEWAKKKESKTLVEETTFEKLTIFEDKLRDYENRYGDKSYLSGVSRLVEPEEKTLDELDSETRKLAEQMIDNSQDEGEVGYEITNAINWRLDGLVRELWGIFDEVGEAIRKKVDEAWREQQNPYGRIMNDVERAKLHENAQVWSARKKEFDKIPWMLGLVFCFRCRKEPIRLLNEEVPEQPLCDTCFEKISKNVLNMKEEIWKQVKEGEWSCDCFIPNTSRHPILYKFAQRNTVSLWTKTEVPIKIELMYGKVSLEAKCRNCGKIQRKELNWGWDD